MYTESINFKYKIDFCLGKKIATSEDDDLPEVDQATKKNLRSRSSTKAK